jgi:hypothetical protein
VSDNIPTSGILFGDDGGSVDERLVAAYMEDIAQGKPMKMPILHRVGNGPWQPVDWDSRARVEACKRSGIGKIRALCLRDVPWEKLRCFCQSLAAGRLRN